MFSAAYVHCHHEVFDFPFGHCHSAVLGAPFDHRHSAVFSTLYGLSKSAPYRRSTPVMNVLRPQTASSENHTAASHTCHFTQCCTQDPTVNVNCH